MTFYFVIAAPSGPGSRSYVREGRAGIGLEYTNARASARRFDAPAPEVEPDPITAQAIAAASARAWLRLYPSALTQELVGFDNKAFSSVVRA